MGVDDRLNQVRATALQGEAIVSLGNDQKRIRDEITRLHDLRKVEIRQRQGAISDLDAELQEVKMSQIEASSRYLRQQREIDSIRRFSIGVFLALVASLLGVTAAWLR